jgi:hypothetical protein
MPPWTNTPSLATFTFSAGVDWLAMRPNRRPARLKSATICLSQTKELRLRAGQHRNPDHIELAGGARV